MRNGRKQTICECLKGIQEVEERKLGEGEVVKNVVFFSHCGRNQLNHYSKVTI